MGNTLLAHVLYSCNKVNIEFDRFFSPTGDAHQIQILSQNSNLIAHHLLEHPRNDVRCLIELTATQWMQVLRYKMSYSKWFKKYPNGSNYNDFFIIKSDKKNEIDKLWQEFYQQIKDPLWGECATFSDIVHLPKTIQTEILSVYKEPKTNFSVLNLLTLNYYDSVIEDHTLNFLNSVEYKLVDYINGDFTVVKNVIQDTLQWNWNDCLSLEFHQRVLTVNAEYLSWLDKIIHVFNQCVSFIEVAVDLELWERAIVLAKACRYFNKHPNLLDWDNDSCFLDKDNVSLIKNLKEVNYGKTI